MKRLLLSFALLALAAGAFAQQSYYYGAAFRTAAMTIDGVKKAWWVTWWIDPYSPAYDAQLLYQTVILEVDGQPATQSLIDGMVSKSSVTLKTKRPGNIVREVTLKGIPCLGAGPVSEAGIAWFDATRQEGVLCNEDKFAAPILEVMADPDVDFYNFATYDFEFTDRNYLQQKELAVNIENILSSRGLKRNAENPDLLVFLEFYCDSREQYVPPTTSISTRYNREYDIWSRQNVTRQYVESSTQEGYTSVRYIGTLSISMLDAKKVREGARITPVVWQSSYAMKYIDKLNHMEFGTDVGLAMLYCFPYPHVKSVVKQNAYFTGIIYDRSVAGRIAAVIPDSPAEKAGLKAGDVLTAASVGRNPIFKESYDVLYKRYSDNAAKYSPVPDGHGYRVERTRVYDTSLSVNPFIYSYMNYNFADVYEKGQGIEFKVKGADGKARTAGVTPVKMFLLRVMW